jgi:hypothetical protein
MHILALLMDAFGSRAGIARYNRDLMAALSASRRVSGIVLLPWFADAGAAVPPRCSSSSHLVPTAPGGRRKPSGSQPAGNLMQSSAGISTPCRWRRQLLVDIEARIPAGHFLRLIQRIVSDVLLALDAEFRRALRADGAGVDPAQSGAARLAAAGVLLDPLGAPAHGAGRLRALSLVRRPR